MILVLETIAWNPHVETAMEIAIREREKGAEVEYFNLRKGLPVCEDVHIVHRLIDIPGERIRRSSQVLRARDVLHHQVTYSIDEMVAAKGVAMDLIADCATQDDLRKVKYGEFYDIGWGVLSSAVSMAANSQVSPTSHGRLISRLLAASVMVYEKSRRLVETRRPEMVVLFNGRFATTRAVLRASESLGVRWQIHERGCNKDHFWMGDCLPHDFELLQKRIRDKWNHELVDAGHAFYRGRREREEDSWYSFTKGQLAGCLPVGISEASTLITFFTSSEDEWVAIGDKQSNRDFPDQVEAIRQVASVVAEMPGCLLCVRVHPHVLWKSKTDQARWRNMDLPGAIVVGPSEKVDTYALMERSKVVCTYGSTVGVEATYWGKPSLLFAQAAYDQLGVSMVARNIDDIRNFLRDPTIGDREAALAFGAYRSTFGERFLYYQARSLFDGKILGVDLESSLAVMFYKWLRRTKRNFFYKV